MAKHHRAALAVSGVFFCILPKLAGPCMRTRQHRQDVGVVG
jgi:hypothetical protein